MQNPETPVAVIQNVLCDKISYDLYFTDRRIVLIHIIDPKRSHYVAGGGIVGEILSEAVDKGVQKVQESRKKQKEEELEGLTLEEMLRKDKKSFAMPYDELKKVKLSYSRWSGNMLALDSTQRYETLLLNKEQSEQLSILLPTISGIKEKFVKA